MIPEVPGSVDSTVSGTVSVNAISGHQNYFLWGPRNCTGMVPILLGDRPED